MREGKSAIMGIAHIYSSGTSRKRNVKTGQFRHRQNVSWHSEKPQVQTGGERAVASGGEKTENDHTSSPGNPAPFVFFSS